MYVFMWSWLKNIKKRIIQSKEFDTIVVMTFIREKLRTWLWTLSFQFQFGCGAVNAGVLCLEQYLQDMMLWETGRERVPFSLIPALNDCTFTIKLHLSEDFIIKSHNTLCNTRQCGASDNLTNSHQFLPILFFSSTYFLHPLCRSLGRAIQCWRSGRCCDWFPLGPAFGRHTRWHSLEQKSTTATAWLPQQRGLHSNWQRWQ